MYNLITTVGDLHTEEKLLANQDVLHIEKLLFGSNTSDLVPRITCTSLLKFASVPKEI